MKYQLFGKSGLRVSEISLGTMTFGEDWGWGTSKEESRKMFDAYAEMGGNFIDTANGYTSGSSEKMVGEFVKGQREQFVIATKYSFSTNPGDPNAGGNHRKNLIQALDASLKRLDIDYIDVYWVHAWDFFTPVEELMRALDDQVSKGKILYIGISDAPAWLISRANTMAELLHWTPFAGLQIEYNLIERTVERELIPMAKALGLTVTAWSPLASGLLTGKYQKNGQSDGGEKRLDKTPSFAAMSDKNLLISQTVVDIAREIGKSPAQVALNWVRGKGSIIPIIGARKFEQFQDNMASLSWELSPAHLQHLEEVSRVSMGFPTDFLHRKEVSDFLHGGTLPLMKDVTMPDIKPAAEIQAI